MLRYTATTLGALLFLACADTVEISGRCDEGGACPDGFVCNALNNRCEEQGSECVAPTVVELRPTFSGDDGLWNGHFRADGSAPCTGSETGAEQCEHAGSRRQVELPGEERCDRITVRDSLGAFDWMCRETENGVTVETKGFHRGFGLEDLLNDRFDGFRAIDVEIFRDSTCRFAVASSSAWSTSVVEPWPADGALNPDRVYVVTSDLPGGLVVDEPGIALVTVNGAQIGPETVACRNVFPSSVCVSANRVWIEVHVDQTGETGDTYAIGFEGGTNRIEVWKTVALEREEGGIVCDNSDPPIGRVRETAASSLVACRGMHVWRSLFPGVGLLGTPAVLAESVTGAAGFSEPSSIAVRTIFDRAASTVSAIDVTGAESSRVFHGFTSGEGLPVLIGAAGDSTSQNALTSGLIESEEIGVRFEGGVSTLQELTIGTSGASPLSLRERSVADIGSDVRIATGSGPCEISTSPGAGPPQSCESLGADSSALVPSLELIGPVESDARVSTVAPNVADDIRWFASESPHRLYRCESGTSGCALVDYRVREASALRYPAPSSDTVCPATVVRIAGREPYLLEAFEMMRDRSGNENGLCEPGELCFWAAAPGFSAEPDSYRFSCRGEFGESEGQSRVWGP